MANTTRPHTAQNCTNLSCQFAPVDNDLGVESYLFCPANLPHHFISLTSNPEDEHHSPPASPSMQPRTATTTTATKSILKPTVTAPTTTTTTAPTKSTTVSFTTPPTRVQRNPSVTSETSITHSEDADSYDQQDGYLGGGALRHVTASHHLADLASLHAAHPPPVHSPQRTLPQRVVHEQHDSPHQGWRFMDWWPESVEMMEHEWTEEFYE